MIMTEILVTLPLTLAIYSPIQFNEAKREAQAEERRKYPLEQRLKERIIGQEGPITTVASGKSKTRTADK